MITRLQAVLRWCFMHVEALSNRAFGERMNPLYHLGSIAFLLFWLIAGTGLYLYAFFDTSVSGAYASVEKLTREQWFVGGVLRSVHRYASDAMVAIMMLHMLRCFAFDRMRGFRWFSWVSGVALIWLVYTSGVNGYMLPWDQLGQFAVTASFEWLSWLPGFGGTLLRNVIYPSSVNDRFFSLLVFIHIGVPLMLLLLMWIHVQRVPKAKMLPPRAIAVRVVLMMLTLAAFAPVFSQGGAANLRIAPATVRLDWFYLSGFPLLYRWSIGHVWALAGCITLLLVAMPWLPFRRRSERREFQLAVHPGSYQLTARAGETLLDAGLRAGIALPFECRNGACGVCMCTVLNGSVDPGTFQPSVLTQRMRDEGKALMCCASALSDVEIEVESLEPIEAVRTYAARVERLDRLADEVMRVELSLAHGERIRFAAGQYINVILEDGQRRAFSFANPPQDDERIELHVRWIAGGRFTTHVFTKMQVGDTLKVEGPFGHFTLREGTKPILFIAGATGFAPIKSIVEDAFRRGIQRPMRLYWGVRRLKDLYMLALAERWQREHSSFMVTPVLSEEPSPQWQGRRGLVHEAILRDFPDLSGHEVYVCGSVRMVQAAVPEFLARGLNEEACVSDAFVPAAVSRES